MSVRRTVILHVIYSLKSRAILCHCALSYSRVRSMRCYLRNIFDLLTERVLRTDLFERLCYPCHEKAYSSALRQSSLPFLCRILSQFSLCCSALLPPTLHFGDDDSVLFLAFLVFSFFFSFTFVNLNLLPCRVDLLSKDMHKQRPTTSCSITLFVYVYFCSDRATYRMSSKLFWWLYCNRL